MKKAKIKNQKGFTIIELLLSLFVVGTVMTGIFGLFVLNLRLASEAERRIVALGLSNERMDMVRNLPYVKVGLVEGSPAGDIPRDETVVRNGVSYRVETDIRYIDDPLYDLAYSGGEMGCVDIAHLPPGQSGGSCSDLCVPVSALNAHRAHGDRIGEKCDGTTPEGPDVSPNDYKVVRVEVSWDSVVPGKSIVLVTYVAPRGIPGGEALGTLDFLLLDAEGSGVAGASVTIVNNALSPPYAFGGTTNSEGRVVLAGLEPADGYALTVSKSGLTSEQTYGASGTFIPHAQYEHFSILAGQITWRTFFIDEVSSTTIRTRDEEGNAIGNVVFRWRGTKTIGVDNNDEPVYRIDIEETTNAQGNSTVQDMVWDDYDLIIDGAATGYDIKEVSQLLPLTVDPGEALEVVATLVSHQASSLHVTVVDEQGDFVAGANVRLRRGTYDETLTTGATGQVYFPGDPGEQELTDGDFTLDVTATGFEDYSVTGTVDGTTRFTTQLNSS